MADIVIVFMNAARKKIENRKDEYSVWNPPPSSDSPAARSKGGRFSSAVDAMKKTTAGTMPSRRRVQSQKCDACDATIALVERLCDSITTTMMLSPIAAS